MSRLPATRSCGSLFQGWCRTQWRRFRSWGGRRSRRPPSPPVLGKPLSRNGNSITSPCLMPERSGYGPVGMPMPRQDAWEKVQGRFRFLTDFPFDGFLWATVLRSPVARGKLIGFDAEDMLLRPGVVAVFRAADVPRVRFNPALAPRSRQLQEAADKKLL